MNIIQNSNYFSRLVHKGEEKLFDKKRGAKNSWHCPFNQLWRPVIENGRVTFLEDS
jgi:hypothetical protein